MSGFKTDSAGYYAIVSPGAVLDYVVDWASWLSGDVITTVQWTAPEDLTIVTTSNTTTAATVWLSGFVLLSDYEMACKITTDTGRVESRYFRLKCRKE